MGNSGGTWSKFRHTLLVEDVGTSVDVEAFPQVAAHVVSSDQKRSAAAE